MQVPKKRCQKRLRLYTLAPMAIMMLSASGHAAEYQEPTGGTLASIEFIDDASQKMSMHFYRDAKECTDRTNTGIPGKSQRKLAILAGQELAFTVGMDTDGANKVLAFGALGALVGSNIYKGCTPTVEFIPEAGRTYVFRMDSDGKDCRYKFYAKPTLESQKPDEEVPVVFAEREWFRAWGNSGPWCKKK